jgi:hypothetical protein
VQQGKLSVEALRAVSGKIDKRLAIFVEDEFAGQWLMTVLREGASEFVDEVGVYPVGGDANAVKTHQAHSANPSVSFKSLCYLDGDSGQKDDLKKRRFALAWEDARDDHSRWRCSRSGQESRPACRCMSDFLSTERRNKKGDFVDVADES